MSLSSLTKVENYLTSFRTNAEYFSIVPSIGFTQRFAFHLRRRLMLFCLLTRRPIGGVVLVAHARAWGWFELSISLRSCRTLRGVFTKALFRCGLRRIIAMSIFSMRA